MNTCPSRRDLIHVRQLFAHSIDYGLNEECWRHMICLLGLSCLFESATEEQESECGDYEFATASYCYELTNNSTICPNGNFSIPVLPFVHLMYSWSKFSSSIDSNGYFTKPIAICMNNTLSCQLGKPSLSFAVHNYICWDLEDVISLHFATVGTTATKLLVTVLQSLTSYCSVEHPAELYVCSTGRPISKHRLRDAHIDCFPSQNDEIDSLQICERNLTDRFECFNSDNMTRRRVHRRVLRNTWSDCPDGSDELFPVQCMYEYDCQMFLQYDLRLSLPIVYEELCNGYSIMAVSGSNETDESDCELWPCHARMTRCDGIWNRPNGCDELDCPDKVPTYLARFCSKDEHYCINPITMRLSCLPLEKAGDGNYDCLFGVDERAILDNNALIINRRIEI
ncbi:unnamed protein product [Rotaria sp. Silwood2]|nr:unnamed protein product [Rotaria sp. Silwood2]CAF4467593.1 unnamed protein product [Rotaria sp. Silwood2]